MLVPGPGRKGDIDLYYYVATTGSMHESHLSLPDRGGGGSHVGVIARARRGSQLDSTHPSGSHLLVPAPGKKGDLNLHYHAATTGSMHEIHLSLPDRGEGESRVGVIARARTGGQLSTPDSTHAIGSHLLVPAPSEKGDLYLHYHVVTTGSMHESHLSLPDPGEGDLNLYHHLSTTGSTGGVRLSDARSPEAGSSEVRSLNVGSLKARPLEAGSSEAGQSD